MINKVEIAVREAIKAIERHPQDPAHDLMHHQRVWDNCQMIVDQENIRINIDLLKVSCFWHDVSLNGGWAKDNVIKVSKHLSRYLPSIGFSEDETNIVVLTVRHHEFLEIPKTVECMVLQDADKLDVPSLERITKTYEMYKKGKMSEHDIKSYFITGLKWLPILPSTMYFMVSRKLAEEKINETITNDKLEKISLDLDMIDQSLEVLERMSSEEALEENKKYMNNIKKIKEQLLKMNKLLIVCGSTAVGKTSAALDLANLINGEIISADSRQVYKDMDIGTGKDIPQGAKYIVHKTLKGYYDTGKTRIWGCDLVSPKEEYSAVDYSKIARKIIKDVWKRKKTPILIGGTGFYISSVVDGIGTAGVPKNDSLRKSLEKLSIDELFEKLALLDAVKAASLNSSDKNNSRRLVRAIEVAQWELANKGERKKSIGFNKDSKVLFIGLTTSRKRLEKLIDKRVDKRMDRGMIDEVNKLLRQGVNWDDQSMNALGYRQLKEYIEGKEKLIKAVKNWKKEELKYSKRQTTWFSKDKRIKWFEIDKKDYPKNMENFVLKWYKE